MNKPALVVVEQEAIVSTETSTVAEKLRVVLKEIIAKLGRVTINVTQQRADACIPHPLSTCTTFDERSAYQGPHGLWIMQMQGTLCSPQVGEVPFREWVEKSYTNIGNGEMTQPPGNFTRWN